MPSIVKSRQTVENGGNLMPHRGRGRPPGVVNKMTREVKDVIKAVFDGLGGVDMMLAWAMQDDDHLTAFYTKIYPKLLPLEVYSKTTTTEQVVVRTYKEVRTSLVRRGVPEDYVDDLLQARVKMPALFSDVASD